MPIFLGKAYLALHSVDEYDRAAAAVLSVTLNAGVALSG
jgi:hypothetical protein